MDVESKYCFFPNGDLFVGDSPCFPNEEVSPCCGLDSGYSCLTNGICYHLQKKKLARGTCTDRSWDSPNCPQYCTESSYSCFRSLFLNGMKMLITSDIDEFTGHGGWNYSKNGVDIWVCSNKPAVEGGLMCCDIAVAERNGSCCPGNGAINLFTMGSKLGTATSIVLSSSTSFSISATSLSNIDSPFSSSSLSSSLKSSSAASSPASNQLTRSGRTITIAVAVSTSIGVVVLIIAGYLIYQHRQRKRRIIEQNHIVEQRQNDMEPYDPKELSGQQEHELPASLRDITQELA